MSSNTPRPLPQETKPQHHSTRTRSHRAMPHRHCSTDPPHTAADQCDAPHQHPQACCSTHCSPPDVHQHQRDSTRTRRHMPKSSTTQTQTHSSTQRRSHQSNQAQTNPSHCRNDQPDTTIEHRSCSSTPPHTWPRQYACSPCHPYCSCRQTQTTLTTNPTDSTPSNPSRCHQPTRTLPAVPSSRHCHTRTQPGTLHYTRRCPNHPTPHTDPPHKE